MHRTFRKIMGAVAAGLMLTGAMATPSAAKVAAVNWVWLGNRQKSSTGLTLALAFYGNPGGANKTPAVVKTRVAQSNQAWSIEHWGGDEASNGPFVMFRSASTSSWPALSILNNEVADGAKVVQYTYQYENPFQRWRVDTYGANIRYRNLGTNRCLAVTNGSQQISPLATVIVYTCGIGLDQAWFDIPYTS